MKKSIRYLAAALTGACFLSVSACGAEKPEIVGNWEMYSGEADGVTLSGDTLVEAVGFDMTIEIKEDGTFEATNSADEEETASGEWKEEDGKYILESEGTPLTCTLSDGDLVMEENGVKLIFKK